MRGDTWRCEEIRGGARRYVEVRGDLETGIEVCGKRAHLLDHGRLLCRILEVLAALEGDGSEGLGPLKAAIVVVALLLHVELRGHTHAHDDIIARVII